jgi:hypothetical protein
MGCRFGALIWMWIRLRCEPCRVMVAAILGGAHIVRVHDPGAVLPAVRIADALLAANNPIRP